MIPNKIKGKQIIKIVIGFVLMSLVFGGLFYNKSSAQTSSDDIKEFTAELRVVAESLKLQHESQTETIERKTQFVGILRDRLDETLHEKESSDNERRLSLFAYELFVAEARLTMEELKLWQIERMLFLQTQLDTPQESEAIAEYLDELRFRRKSAYQINLDRSEELSPFMTDKHILNQFDSFIKLSLHELSD